MYVLRTFIWVRYTVAMAAVDFDTVVNLLAGLACVRVRAVAPASRDQSKQQVNKILIMIAPIC